MRPAPLPCALAFASLLLTSPAQAAVVTDDGIVITAVTLGILGGITTSVAAIVYAVEDRAFTPPWVVSTVLSASVTGVMTYGIVTSGEGTSFTGIMGVLFFGAITAWPAYWTIKSALHDVEPGESFDVPRDPEQALKPTQSLPTTFGWSIDF